jgi:hypothetical protein
LKPAREPSTSTPFSSSIPSFSSPATSEAARAQQASHINTWAHPQRPTLCMILGLFWASLAPLELHAHTYDQTNLGYACFCRVGINRYNFLLESLQDIDARYV